MRSRTPSAAPGTTARSPPMRWRWCRGPRSRPLWKKPSPSASPAPTSAASNEQRTPLVVRIITGVGIAVQLKADIRIRVLADISAARIDRRRATVRLRRRAQEQTLPGELLRPVDALALRLVLGARQRRVGCDERQARSQDHASSNNRPEFHAALLLRAA